MANITENNKNTNFNISNRNVFDKAFEDFSEASETTELFEFFQDKTFWKRTKKIAFAFMILTIICNVISALTESVFLFDIFQKGIGYWTISVVITIGLVLTIEIIKRATLPDVFKHAFQYRKIDFINLLIYLVFAGMSILLSFKGGALIPAAISSPTLLSVDSISANYDLLIAAKAAEAKNYKASNQWRGAIVREAKPTYNKLVQAKLNLEEEKRNQVAAAIANNQKTEIDHNQKTASDGVTLGYITIACELLFLLMYSFLIYRKYRHFSQFAQVHNHDAHTKTIGIHNTASQYGSNPITQPVTAITQPVVPPTPVVEPVRRIGFKYGEKQETTTDNDTRNDTRNNESTTGKRTDGNRECKECGQLFIYKTWNHVYCSDACRIKSWEKKNGKALPKYRKV